MFFPITPDGIPVDIPGKVSRARREKPDTYHIGRAGHMKAVPVDAARLAGQTVLDVDDDVVAFANLTMNSSQKKFCHKSSKHETSRKVSIEAERPRECIFPNTF